MKVADEQAEKLRNEIRNLKQTLQNKDEEIQSMKKALSNREVEINRLQATNYVGDDNKEELKLRYNNENIQEQNDKLLTQINFLNKENHRLREIDHFHTHR